MSVLAYQMLKPSGIEYLDGIPNDWSLKRLGDLVAFAQGKAHEPYIDDDGDYICVNSRFVSTSGKTIKTCSINLTPASLNDILMVMSDLPNGRALARAYYVDDHGKYAVNQRVCRITAEKAYPRFLFYLLDRHPGLMQNDDGVHQTHLSNADFQKLKLYLPSISEQNQIARFLDHETARIDALIEEQQRLIELLKEKRQAVVSHAVTKGLDPTVQMKDSGVEWLGEVPAHWTIKLSKYLFEFVTSGSRGWADFYADEGKFFFRITNLTRDSIEPKLESIQYVNPPESSEGIRAKVKLGDILISITADLGSVCVANEDVSDSYVSQHVALARPFHSCVFSRWIGYCVLSTPTKEQLAGAGYGGTKIQLSLEDIKSFLVAHPPYLEQVAIVEFLDGQVKKFDLLIRQALAGVSLLAERRSALISAAVTGKIDVRSWQPPASVQAHELAKEAV
ncbi:hypothetical protein PS647_04051 [Pseudomonas fluorescens]|jgi:type I restriction enzyme S subunit|uniref:restriction endonuclease subunit S n=1 Tax=Pseudomonas fluorescens TaxID=294 RepID=UPI001240BB9B|nr:restriction endonuclease subunit S [Pseudomonas fluorescens]VVN14995.1 hypothetical protein PS647_04051 [Pseudomonas fluorescens]